MIVNSSSISNPSAGLSVDEIIGGTDEKILEGESLGAVGALKQAREAVLKEDLHVMRSAIDSYTMDKQKAPQSLDDLITDGYLKAIPEDPMTHSKTTWVTNTGDALHSVDQTDPGIDDIHSGSDETGSDGQAYSAW